MKCEVCGNIAVIRYTPDLDVVGLGACGDHKEVIRMAYLILTTEGEEEYQKYMRNLRRQYKKENLIK